MNASNASNIEEEAQKACLGLLPKKSVKRYELTYKLFEEWCQINKETTIISESLLLAYFLEKFILIKNMYLLMKAVMIMGIAGACRGQELCEMKLTDVTEKNEIIIVKVPDSKNGMLRTFTITACREHKVCYLQIVKKYIDIRSKIGNVRFFMRYQGGRCYNQPVDKNTIAEIPSKVAKFLNLDNPKGYTGHSFRFRRSSTTLLANAGAEVLTLKRHGSWKSGNIVETYVAESIANKKAIANKILYDNHGGDQGTSLENKSEEMIVSKQITEISVTDKEGDNNIELLNRNVNI